MVCAKHRFFLFNPTKANITRGNYLVSDPGGFLRMANLPTGMAEGGIASLQDPGQPYSCTAWQNHGVPGMPLILDENQSSSGFFSLFHDSWNAFPSFVIIDHTMTVIHKQSGGAGFSVVQSLINGMLDNLYASLLVSADVCRGGAPVCSGMSTRENAGICRNK